MTIDTRHHPSMCTGDQRKKQPRPSAERRRRAVARNPYPNACRHLHFVRKKHSPVSEAVGSQHSRGHRYFMVQVYTTSDFPPPIPFSRKNDKERKLSASPHILSSFEPPSCRFSYPSSLCLMRRTRHINTKVCARSFPPCRTTVKEKVAVMLPRIAMHLQTISGSFPLFLENKFHLEHPDTRSISPGACYGTSAAAGKKTQNTDALHTGRVKNKKRASARTTVDPRKQNDAPDGKNKQPRSIKSAAADAAAALESSLHRINRTKSGRKGSARGV